MSSRTCVYSLRLRWSSSSDGSNFNSSSTLDQFSFVLLSTNDRRLVMRQGGGSRIGVCSRLRLKLTNSMRGICDKMLKTCWIHARDDFSRPIYLKRRRAGSESGPLPLGSARCLTFLRAGRSYLIPILQFVLRQVELLHRVAFLLQVFRRSGLIDATVVEHKHLRHAVRSNYWNCVTKKWVRERERVS